MAPLLARAAAAIDRARRLGAATAISCEISRRQRELLMLWQEAAKIRRRLLDFALQDPHDETIAAALSEASALYDETLRLLSGGGGGMRCEFAVTFRLGQNGAAPAAAAVIA